MRYHYKKPDIYLSMYGKLYICNHPVYDRCTLFTIGDKGLAVIQQRFNPDTKTTYWTEVDSWLTDSLYLHPKFKKFFDERAGECTDGLYPTVSIRQIIKSSRIIKKHGLHTFIETHITGSIGYLFMTIWKMEN